jgi:hypothetical protein
MQRTLPGFFNPSKKLGLSLIAFLADKISLEEDMV